LVDDDAWLDYLQVVVWQSNSTSADLLCRSASNTYKARNAKRRVVKADLIDTLAKFMPEGGEVILQSDVKGTFDAAIC